MVKVLNIYEEVMASLAYALDYMRTALLAITMKSPLLRSIYGVRSLRLGFGFLIMSLFYFPIALNYPEVLLVAGPLIFGYPHLVASYRFTRPEQILNRFTNVQTLIAITALVIAAGLSLAQILPALPFGFWEIASLSVCLIVLKTIAPLTNARRLSLCLAVNLGLLYSAWQEPILFLGGTLILHNWVAFAFWIRAAKGLNEKSIALAATAAFGLIHYAVFHGFFDAWMPLETMDAGARATGWYLASWSYDPTIWYRLVVLYTFGLSLHYFVWLKAIPESGMKTERPNSFRVSLEHLRRDVGDKTLLLVIFALIATIAVYAVSTVIGARVYFAVAALHGWFEISFFLLGRPPLSHDS